MKFIYPAVVHKNEDGTFHAVFPDLTLCEAEGEDLDECLGNAVEAAYNWIQSELEEDEPELPPISDPEDIILQEGDEIRNILVNLHLMPGYDE